MLAFLIVIVVLIAVGVALRLSQRTELALLSEQARGLGIVVPRFATPGKLRRLIRKEQKRIRQADPSQRAII